ncbi:MAG: arsenate reductase ArsC [Candidatus Ranarchaeia archaeon]
MYNTKTRVLFVCMGNSARSQMAEAFLRKYGKDRFEAYSAGIKPKPVNRFTIMVMKEIGLDLTEYSSKSFKDLLQGHHFDVVITVCAEAEKRCPFVPGIDKRMHWPFEDPVAFQGNETETVAKFRTIRDQIQKRVITWLKEERAIKEAT